MFDVDGKDKVKEAQRRNPRGNCINLTESLCKRDTLFKRCEEFMNRASAEGCPLLVYCYDDKDTVVAGLLDAYLHFLELQTGVVTAKVGRVRKSQTNRWNWRFDLTQKINAKLGGVNFFFDFTDPAEGVDSKFRVEDEM